MIDMRKSCRAGDSLPLVIQLYISSLDFDVSLAKFVSMLLSVYFE